MRFLRLSDIAFGFACLTALAVLLWLGSGLTFVHDEWALITAADDWSFEALMRPHNDHFMPLLRLVWNTLMATIGLRSYLPYLLVDYLLVIAAATAVYVYGRRHTHALIALVAGTTFLLLGSGAGNLFHAFQMAWMGAAAAGSWALVVLLTEPRPRRAWWVSLLLVLGILWTGSLGLPFVAGAALVIAVSSRLRRHCWVVLPPIAIYALWYVTYGQGTDLSLPPLPAIAAFVENGIGYAFGRITAVGSEIGIVLVALLVLAALADAAIGRRPRLGLIAGVTGLGALWLLIAIGRAGSLPDTFTAPRYVHISGIFVLFAVVGWLGQRRFRRPAEPLRLAMVAGLVAIVILGWNVNHLVRIRGIWAADAQAYRAAVSILLTRGGSPALPADRGLVRSPDGLRLASLGATPLIPGPTELAALIEKSGSPLDDPLARGSIAVPDAVADRVFDDLVGSTLEVGPAVSRQAPVIFDVAAMRDAEARPVGACLELTPTGPNASMDMLVPGAGVVTIESTDGGTASAMLSLTGAFGAAEHPFELMAMAPLSITVPSVGNGALWLRLGLPPTGTSTICEVSDE